jgi:probable F420-dependent oxidoreductase
MRIGLTSPVVTANPGAHAPWEADAGATELVRIGALADELGYDHLTCSEHVAVPAGAADERGARYWDPAVTLTLLAAHTQRIRLATQVLVLPYHHPLQVAKQYGTLDVVSGGRVVLGVGVGSLPEEFALLGVSWTERGAVTDDFPRALQAAWGRREPAYDGPHHSFAGMGLEPHAVRTSVPVWVGGRTARSLRRAVELGSGWVPFGLRADDLTAMLGDVDLPDDFDVVLGPGRPLDPLGDADGTRRRLDRTVAAGATVLTVTVAARSCDHYLEQLDRLSELQPLTPPNRSTA